MARWLVTQGNNQFTVEGLGELKELAKAGKLGPGDMIQPPGATDWVYASEIPDINKLFPQEVDDDDDDYLAKRRNTAAMVTMAVAGFLVLVLVVGVGGMAVAWSQLSVGDAPMIGEGGLSYTEMLVTQKAGASLLSEPKGKARQVKKVKHNQVLELLAKRRKFYKAQTKGGDVGWIPVDDVVPMYQLGGADVREKYDPLYNPDLYVDVANARWSQLPDQEADRITVFQFAMSNKSEYAMTDLVILATIKDGKGQEIEKVEIPVEGVLPPSSRTMVGTLHDDEPGKRKRKRKAKSKGKAKGGVLEGRRLLTNYTLDAMAESDPDVRLRFTDGAEVGMRTEQFTHAEIDIIELRAMPDDEARKVQAKLAKSSKAKGSKGKKNK